MKIGVPVKCQNGHRAVWFYRFRGLDVISEGVPEKGKCDCPKEDWGEGYFADGEPFVVVGNPPQWEEQETLGVEFAQVIEDNFNDLVLK